MFLIGSFFLVVAANDSSAQRSQERMEKVTLSGDKGAVYKALELYKYYWQQFNVTFDASAPANADYLKLSDKKSRNEFIVLIRKTDVGGECVRLGCEISVFENTRDNRWKLILHVFSRDLYISNQKTDGYYNLFVRSSTKDIDESASKNTKFVWNGGKYVAEHRLGKDKG